MQLLITRSFTRSQVDHSHSSSRLTSEFGLTRNPFILLGRETNHPGTIIPHHSLSAQQNTPDVPSSHSSENMRCYRVKDVAEDKPAFLLLALQVRRNSTIAGCS